MLINAKLKEHINCSILLEIFLYDAKSLDTDRERKVDN